MKQMSLDSLFDFQNSRCLHSRLPLFFGSLLGLRFLSNYQIFGSVGDIVRLCKQGKLDKALDLTDESNVCVSNDVIFALLQACSKQENCADAKQVHYLMVDNGLDSVSFLTDHLIRLFASCGSLLEANKIFGKIRKPSVYTWNAIISAHSNAGEGQRALKLFYRMKEEGVTPNRITYLSILKVCLTMNAFEQGRLIHDEINSSECKLDVVVGNTLIDMYAKFGRLGEAHEIFDNMPMRDVVSWGAMIAGYTQHGHSVFALKFFKEMQLENVKPDRIIFASVLKASGHIGALEEGRLIHEQLLRNGHEFEPDLVVGNTLVDMYGKCGSLEDAKVVFNSLSTKDVISWDALISGYVNNGCELASFGLFEEMHLKRVKPVKATYLCVLKACGNAGTLHHGRKVHDEIMRTEYMLDRDMGNTLVDVYAKCQSLHDAQRVFDRLHIRDVVSWSALIVGYATHGHDLLVLELFEKMQEEGVKPSEIIVSLVLKACGSMRALEHGKLIHSKITQNELASDRVVQNTLIDMYVKWGNLKEAHKVFTEVLGRDVVSWGAIISGNAQHGHSFQALKLFERMQQEGIKPNKVLFSSILKACGDLGETRAGMLIHNQVIQYGCDSITVVGNTLVDMYGKCANLDEACRVFNGLQLRDVVSWAAMIAGYVQHGYGFHALGVYARMQQQGMEASRVIFLHILKACGMVGAIEHSRLVHYQIVESELEVDVVIGNTLIDMYAKCGSIEEAQQVFNRVSGRNVVTWAAMITGYAACGDCLLAWQCLEDMQRHGLEPDGVIFSSILSACSYSGLLDEGRDYFKSMREEFGITPSIEHYSCIVDLLARVGGLDEAGNLVSTLPVSPDPVVWRSLLANCKTYSNLELARHSFHGVVQQGPTNASGFVLMSNLYADAQLWEDLGRTQELKLNVGVQKKAGKAWIEVSNGVHEFVVGGKSHVNHGFIFSKFKRLSRPSKDRGYMPQLDIILE